MSCDCNGCCHDDCCPEVVPVTINENTYTMDGVTPTITVEDLDPADVTKKNVVVEFDVEGLWDLRCWWVDNPNLPTEKSIVVPTGPGSVQFEKVTDSDGTLTFEVENTGAFQTWYLVIACGQVVTVSPAIGIGV